MIYLVGVLSVILYSALIYWLVGSGKTQHPFRLLICVLMGIVSGGLSLAGEYIWNLVLGDFISSHHSLIFLESFVGVSAIEEVTKWLWLVFFIRHWPSFNRYADGIIYTCAIAAGFTLLEGILFARTDGVLVNVIIRGFTSVPVHFLFAIIMGFLFARYKFESPRFFWFSILIPVTLHGLYDFFIFQQYAELLMGGAILILGGCLSLSIWVCRTALQADRFRRIQT
jgi:RsiW-degrading membrane proteinase PrsW (M82 family)